MRENQGEKCLLKEMSSQSYATDIIFQLHILVGNDMNKLCIFVGLTVLGWVGWWIGAKIGFMTGFILSGIGSIAGVYVGWWINREYLS